MGYEMHLYTRKILHWISVAGVFFILFGSLSLLQMYTIGQLFHLNNLVYCGIPIAPVIYATLSVIIILKFFRISSNYKN